MGLIRKWSKQATETAVETVKDHSKSIKIGLLILAGIYVVAKSLSSEKSSSESITVVVENIVHF